MSGNLLACLPLELKLRGKSTTQSYRSAIYYVDIGVRSGSTLEEAIVQARELDERRRAAGFDQAALDAAARAGFANGAFEESAEDGAAIVDEFPDAGRTDGAGSGIDGDTGADATGTTTIARANGSSTLRQKLERKAVLPGGAAA